MPFVLTGLLAGCNAASALEFTPGIGAGLEYTDNAALTAKDTDNDLLMIGFVGARINENDGPLTAAATTTFRRLHYTKDTFSDQNYFTLGAVAGWEMIADRVDWDLRNYFTQRKVNALDPDTPDNTQNTNVFSLGTNIATPLSERQQIVIYPEFRDYYYENSDTDNRQYKLSANWFYRLFPTASAGLGGSARKIDYDDDDKNPDATFYGINGTFSGTRVRSEYNFNLGYTEVRRDHFDDQSGVAGSLVWLYRLTGRSTARLYAASELTDTNTGLYNSEANPDNGDFSNEQISGDVLRDNIMRLSYARQGTTQQINIWGEWRDLDYKEAPDDRKVKTIGAAYNYRVTAFLTTGVYGSYSRTKQTDTRYKDKRKTIGGNLGYNLTRNLCTNFDIRYRKKNANTARDDYDEFGAFVSLIYGFGGVQGKGIRSYHTCDYYTD